MNQNTTAPDVRLIRAQMPTGRTVTITFHVDGPTSRVSTLVADVLEHDRDAVYLGAHPFMLCMPYVNIVTVNGKSVTR